MTNNTSIVPTTAHVTEAEEPGSTAFVVLTATYLRKMKWENKFRNIMLIFYFCNVKSVSECPPSIDSEIHSDHCHWMFLFWCGKVYPCIHVVTQLNLTFNYMFQSKTNLFMNVIKYGLSYNFNMLTKCRPNSIKTISNCTKTINNIHDEAYTKVISNICPSSFVGFGQADVMRGATRTHMTSWYCSWSRCKFGSYIMCWNVLYHYKQHIIILTIFVLQNIILINSIETNVR